MAGGDLDVTQVDTGVEHGGHEGVPEHVWVHPGDLHAGLLGEPTQPAGCAVPVHPSAEGGEENRTGGPVANAALEGTPDRRWERDQYDLVSFAVDTQHAVTVLFAEVLDVAGGGLEDPQANSPSMATRAKSHRFSD